MYERIIETLNKSVPQADRVFLGQDGLLYCRTCKKPLETEITVFNEVRKVRCICDCKKAELDAAAEQERLQEAYRKRKICFAESNMHSWTFANDDGKNPKLSTAMKNYVDNFAEFRRDGKGLLLFGTVGTGKSYLAACIANALIDKDYSVLMTNFATLTNKLQGMFEGKQEFINSLNRYSLLIIDDLGAERKSEFMQEQVFNIIDSRYRSGLPFIVTTNLTAEELKKTQDVGYSRIYDRILERCFPVEVAGGSRRRENLKNSFADVKGKLGL